MTKNLPKPLLKLKKQVALWFLTLLIVLPVSKLCAQKWTLEVMGNILSGGKNLSGAKAAIYADSNLVMSVTLVNGTFDFFLEPDNDYTLTFSKAGYVNSYIVFSTKNVPEKRAKDGFSPYHIIVLLSPKKPGAEANQAVNAPQAVVKYDPAFEDGDFTSDQSYSKSIKPFLKVVNHEVKEAVDQQQADNLKSEREKEAEILISAAIMILLLIAGFSVYIVKVRKEKQKLLDELNSKKSVVGHPENSSAT